MLPTVPVCQEEIAELKRKMRTMNNQVARLRDEISGKESALAKDEQEHKRLDKDNEALKVLPSALSVATHPCFHRYGFYASINLHLKMILELFTFTGPLCFYRGSCS